VRVWLDTNRRRRESQATVLRSVDGKYGKPGTQRPKGFFPRIDIITVYAVARMTGKETPLPPQSTTVAAMKVRITDILSQGKTALPAIDKAAFGGRAIRPSGWLLQKASRQTPVGGGTCIHDGSATACPSRNSVSDRR
jgi:hypothetical protein